MNTNKRIVVGPLMTLASGVMMIAMCLLQPATAQAQWTTADGNGNINNTNTNNVGVGTTQPNYKFDITNALDRAQVRFGMGAGDSGGFLYSGGPAHAVFSAGAAYNSGWIAKSLSASMIEANLGQLTFYTNPGISTGSPFTPTARMVVTSAGNIGIGTSSPGARLVTFGNFLAGNITSHTQLYSGYDAQSNVIMELGYGTPTAALTPLASLVLSKNLTSTNQSIGVISFANSNIADGNEKRLSSIGTSTDGAVNSGVMAFGTALAGTLNERMRITSSGNVGIGTTTPSGLLSLRVPAGDVIQAFSNAGGSGGELHLRYRYESALHRMGFSDSSGNWLFYSQYGSPNTNAIGYFPGKVGIGISAPVYSLHVQGGSINASDGLCINGDCKTSWSSVGGSQWTGSSALNYSGNVGVGLSTAPARRLEVFGGNVFHQWSTTGGSEYGFYTSINNNHLASNMYFDGAWKMIAAGKGAFVGPAPLGGFALNVYGDNTSRAANAVASPIHLFSVSMNGNVGVGTTAPAFDASGTKFLSVDAGGGGLGSIGAGGGTSSNATAVGQVAFVNSNLGSTDKRLATIVGSTDTATNSGAIDFWTASAGTFSAARMRITSSGNVGIATSNPTEKLEVTGNVKVSGTVEGGTIKAKYQDVAEWVDSSQDLDAGTVVVLDRSRSNQVVAATRSYDSHVAGVISLRPGLALGQGGEGRVLVATTGRVKVKVDATNGPIEIGDLLVTSDREGFAMKSLPVDIGGVRIHRPGTLIGKALEPLAKGTDEILVLLSMQ